MTFSRKELLANGVDPEAVEVRQLRRRLKITQAEFAAMAGVSWWSVWAFETGRRSPRPKTRQKILGLLVRWQVAPPEPHRETRGRRKRAVVEPANDICAFG